MDTAMTQWVRAVWGVWLSSSLMLKIVAGQYTQKSDPVTTTARLMDDPSCSYVDMYYDLYYRKVERSGTQYVYCVGENEYCCGNLIKRYCCFYTDDSVSFDPESVGSLIGAVVGGLVFSAMCIWLCSRKRKATKPPATGLTGVQAWQTHNAVDNPIAIPTTEETAADNPTPWHSTSLPPPSYEATGGTSNPTNGTIASTLPVGPSTDSMPPPSYEEYMANTMIRPMVGVNNGTDLTNSGDRTLDSVVSSDTEHHGHVTITRL